VLRTCQSLEFESTCAILPTNEELLAHEILNYIHDDMPDFFENPSNSKRQTPQIMPLIEELANEALKGRHWEQIFGVIGAPYSANAPFSIDDLLAHNILLKMDDVSRVSTNASKEHSLEKSLTKMVTDWDGLEFRTVAYKDTGTFIVGGVDEIQAILDDQIVKIQSMRASPFIRPFEARATEWQDTLSTLQDLLDNWLTCQVRPGSH
jgi:dynein heavy chain